MATSYIPAKDADFNNWLVNFDTLLTGAPTDYGLTAPIAVIVAGVTAAWSAAYLAATDPSTRTAATVAAKDAARASAEATVRPYAIQIRNNPAVSDLLKVGIGVTIPAFPPSPVPAPTVPPVLGLESAIPLEQLLSYGVPGGIGKAKPFGAIGVEIWRSVGTVPATDPAQCVFKGTVTKSPFRQAFLAPDQGKIVTYFARFVTRSGPGGVAQAGPWSAPLTLVVM
jgi:hypothetical protein